MKPEIIAVDLLVNNAIVITAELIVYEDIPNDDDNNVLIEIHIGEKIIKKRADDLFSAMQEIRKELELGNIHILCNGAALNVHPSPMQMSAGNGRKAYVLKLGYPAKLDDVVDIFEKRTELSFVYVEEQELFYSTWLKSILDR